MIRRLRQPFAWLALVAWLAASGLSWDLLQVVAWTNTSAYLYYSRSLNTVNLADKPSGAEVNAVHSTDVWSFGLTHTF